VAAVAAVRGYALAGTAAAWTVLVVMAVRPGRLSGALGLLSAALILAGLLVPLAVPGADLANFIGYVLWSLFLVVLALSRPRVLKVA
jgi:hypothetical protein